MNQLRIRGLSALCFIIFSIAFSACNKRESNQSVSTYTFKNTLSEDVTIEVYDTKEDYYSRRNALKTLKLPANGSLPVEFEAIRTYYLDWYTADFMLSNWAARGFQSLFATPSPEFIIAAVDNTVWISSSTPDISRSILLNGNELSSSWRLDIDGVPPLNGTHIFTFRRDYTGQYKFIPQSGTATEIPIKLLMSQASRYTFRMYIMNDAQGQVADAYFNSDPGFTPHSVRDTMMVAFRMPTSTSYFAAKRQ